MGTDFTFSSTTVRDAAISTICSNLAWCGILHIQDVSGHMTVLTRMTDKELALQLTTSRLMLDEYLRSSWRLN